MKLVTATTILLSVTCLCTSLECGIGLIRHDRLGQTIQVCLKSNKTLARLWDNTQATISTSSSQSDSSSSESDDVDTLSQYRYRRATATASIDGSMNQAKGVSRHARAGPAPDQTTTPSSSENGVGSSGSTEDTSDNSTSSTNCVVQCIFQNMNMTDDNGYPDHQKIVDGLVNTATRREMKDFLRDTAVKCFDDIDKDKELDSCTYSTKLINCLADKGKENCSDWPVGNLPF